MSRKVVTRDGAAVPVLGQGTWKMGQDPREHKREVEALRLGLDLGMTLIDTAEMYADGGAERVVAEAIVGRRDDVFLVSKVLPSNASREGTIAAAERSLERLRTDRLDLYLLHWTGSWPLEETYGGFERLVEQGKILHYGVSNFDVDDMQRSESLPAGARVGVNQVLYNPTRRGIEPALLPWCAARDIVVMAYSPLEQGRLRARAALRQVAERHDAKPEQVVLAWVLRHPNVVTIPKAVRTEHVRDNAAAGSIRLTEEDLADLDRDLPPPPAGGRLELL